jgi:hypothetical protein
MYHCKVKLSSAQGGKRMAKIHSVNVRALAEFTLQRGDLTMAAVDRMNEGSKGHRQLHGRRISAAAEYL